MSLLKCTCYLVKQNNIINNFWSIIIFCLLVKCINNVNTHTTNLSNKKNNKWRAEKNEQQIKNNKQQAESNGQGSKSNEQKVKSKK